MSQQEKMLPEEFMIYFVKYYQRFHLWDGCMQSILVKTTLKKNLKALEIVSRAYNNKVFIQEEYTESW